MLFFIVIVAALALWGVIAAVIAMTRDGRGDPDVTDTRSIEDRRSDYPLVTDPHFFVR